MITLSFFGCHWLNPCSSTTLSCLSPHKILSKPAEIVGGTVNLQFSPDFTRVTGTATFYGNGYIEPGSSAWSANFTGLLAQTYVGLAEGNLAGAFY